MIRTYVISRIKSIFTRWLLSYLAILFVPVLLGSVIFSYSLKNMRIENDLAQKQLLEQMKQHFDGQINLLYNVSYMMLNSVEAKNLFSTDKTGSYSAEQLLSIPKLQNQLLLETTINDMISSVYLYFSGSGSILSYSLLLPLEHTEQYAKERYGCSIRELEGLLQQEHLYGNLCVMDGRLFYYYNNRIETKKSAEVAMVFMELDKKAIQPGLSLSNAATFLLGEDAACYSPDGLDVPDKELQERILEASEGKKLEHQKHYILSLKAEQVPWYYVSATSKEKYQKKLDQMTGIVAVYFLVCIIGGGFLVWALAKKNYLPVKELLQFVGKADRQSGDEFVLLRESYQEIRTAYTEGKIEQRALKKKLENQKLLDYLTGRSEQAPGEAFAAWEYLTEEKPYRMLAIEIIVEETEDPEKSQVISSKDLEIAYFILGNVFQELFGEAYSLRLIEGEGMLLSLVCGQEKEQPGQAWMEEDIPRRLGELSRFLREHYQLRCLMYASEEHIGVGQLTDSFQEIQLEIEYRSQRKASAPELLWLKNVEDAAADIHYSNQCKRIYQTLLEKQPERALAFFSELFAGQQFQKEPLPAGTEGQSKIEQIVEGVRQYIDQHYTENTLTIGRISEVFQTNQSYLSREFKRIQGCGMLEYLGQLRLKSAKELLAEGNTVREAALKIGYFDTQPLTRLFRQIEGITPGEYRQGLQNNNPEEVKK